MHKLKANLTAITLLVAAALLLGYVAFAGTQIRDTGAGYQIATTAQQTLGFFGVAPVAQPANTRTARQAMQDLGLLAAGGAQDSDVVSSAADTTLAEGVDFAVGTSTGTKVATATAQKLAFHGATPVIQRAGTAQAAVTTTVGAAVATTAPTNSSPYGFGQTQATDLVARVNQLRADVLALTDLTNELRASLVEKGLIKGSN